MGLLVAGILFVIMAIGAAFDGDYSGLEMIGKFILFIILFLVIGTIITSPVLLIIALAIIILAVVSKSM